MLEQQLLRARKEPMKYGLTEGCQCGHNELVLSPRAWVANLPHTVLAFFTVPAANDADNAKIRAARAKFVDEYPEREREHPTPLLMYDPSTASEASGPFTVL